MGWEGFGRCVERARGVMHAGTLRLAARRSTTRRSHTWLAALGDGSVRVGLDDLAQKILPGARVLQFAPVGARAAQGRRRSRRSRSATTACSIGAPTTGRVRVDQRAPRRATRRCCTATRTAAAGSPRCMPADARLRGVPDGRAGRAAWIRREDHRLNAFLETELGIAAADGGEWIVAPTTMLSEEQFEALAREFLSAKAEVRRSCRGAGDRRTGVGAALARPDVEAGSAAVDGG